MPWIFDSFLVTPCALTSCHVLISKQDNTIRALGYNKWPCDENHAVRFRQCAENRSRARNTQPNRGVSDKLARGCKPWHPLAPGRRYEKKKSSLWVYVSLSISQLTTNDGPLFENKTRDISLLRSVFFRSLKFVNYIWLCFRLYLYYGYTTLTGTIRMRQSRPESNGIEWVMPHSLEHQNWSLLTGCI